MSLKRKEVDDKPDSDKDPECLDRPAKKHHAEDVKNPAPFWPEFKTIETRLVIGDGRLEQLLDVLFPTPISDIIARFETPKEWSMNSRGATPVQKEIISSYPISASNRCEWMDYTRTGPLVITGMVDWMQKITGTPIEEMTLRGMVLVNVIISTDCEFRINVRWPLHWNSVARTLYEEDRLKLSRTRSGWVFNVTDWRDKETPDFPSVRYDSSVVVNLLRPARPYQLCPLLWAGKACQCRLCKPFRTAPSTSDMDTAE
jgi:hypothetical protein